MAWNALNIVNARRRQYGAAGSHQRQAGLDQEEGSLEIGGELAIKGLIGDLTDRGRLIDAGIGNQGVELTKAARARTHDRLRILRPRIVRHQADTTTAQIQLRPVNPLGIASCKYHASARREKGLRCGKADPTRAPGNQDRPVGQARQTTGSFAVRCSPKRLWPTRDRPRAWVRRSRSLQAASACGLRSGFK